jgi:dihydropteroate synthase
MIALVADTDAGLVVGHLRGQPATMQRDIRFAQLLREVTDELAAAVERAVAAGVERPRIVVDPGIGFGKTPEQSAALVAAAGWLRQATRCPVLVGASRKSFLQAIVGGGTGFAPRDRLGLTSRGAKARTPPLTSGGSDDRLPGSLAAAIVAVERGASVLRVHDVGQTVQALAVARSIRAAYDAAVDREGAGGAH